MKQRSKTSVLISLAFLLFTCCVPRTGSAQAQSPVPIARGFHQVAISHDASHLAWVEPILDSRGESTGGSDIYTQDLKSPDAKPRRISASSSGGNADEGEIAWSPDSKQVAFLSDAERSGQFQLYIAGVGGAARKLTSLTGYLADPAWSPDGKAVAFLFTENAPRAAGPLMPMTPETGVIGAKIYEQRLTVADVATGTIRQL